MDGGADDQHPGLTRILRRPDAARAIALLGDDLSGSDLTTALLEIARRRVAAVSPLDVLAQYERDRFVAPATVDPRALLAMQLVALETVAPQFEAIATSPVAPLGAHAAVAGVHQDRVITTIRRTEVAADPTNSLALEAALRRRRLLSSDARSTHAVRLAGVDRVVRAQQFGGPRSFAHFTLLGLVTAGRATGSREFETAAFAEHVRMLCSICLALGFTERRVHVTDFSGTHDHVLQATIDALAADDVIALRWPERELGRGYYPSVCCKVSVVVGDEEIEVGDGGMVDWTQRLLGNRKERLMISGLGIERLASVAR